MTGAEIVGTGTAVAKALGGAVSSLGKEPGEIDKSLVDAGTGSAPHKAAVEAHNKKVAIRKAAVLKLYSPLRWFVGAPKDYFNVTFADDMADALSSVPEENQVPPRGFVAGPIFEGLANAFEELDLKDLYIQLLAKATDNRSSTEVHPSFVQVVNQLAPEEARLLKRVLAGPRLQPIVELRHSSTGGEGGYLTRVRNVLNWKLEGGAFETPAHTATYVDNWIRLGLINVEIGTFIQDDAEYAWAEKRPEFQAHRLMAVEPGYELKAERGVLVLTDLGKQFGRSIGVRDPEVEIRFT